MAEHFTPSGENCGDTPPRPAMDRWMHDDDARDLAGAQAGDAEAFARLYDRHSAVVLSLCRQHASFDPDDALQETFIRAYQRLHQVDRPDGLRSWLYAIARRVCSERRRAAGRRSRHEAEAVNRRPDPIEHDGVDGSPPRSAERHETLDRLGVALGELPEHERLAIHLYYLDADPVTAARQALGISRSGFYKLLNRARRRLAGLLDGSASTTAPGPATQEARTP